MAEHFTSGTAPFGPLIRQIRRNAHTPATVVVGADTCDPDRVRFEGWLSERLGVPVTVEYAREGSGRLILAFGNLDVLDGLLERLGYRDDLG